MAALNLFFDIRRSQDGVSHAAQVAALLEMCEWADHLPGVATSVGLPEHHGFEDGYLPSPVVLGAAVAARTREMQIELILVLPFYQPIRLAEDLAILDLVSRGRIGLTLVAGYVSSEFDMFGVDPTRRGEIVEESVAMLKAAWTGEEFEHGGRRMRVTPRPYHDGRPTLVLGGSTRAAARRAVRIADGFWPTANPELRDIYREELAAAGKDPGPEPPPPEPFQTLVAVSNDPDRVWEVVGPFCMYETNHYHDLHVAAFGDKLAAAFGDPPAYPQVGHWKELRESGRYLVLTPDECVELARRHGDAVTIQPLTSGIPPALASESLRLIERDVLPALADA